MSVGKIRLLCCGLLVLLGLLVLTGWFLQIEVLKSVLPGLSTMKVNTAIGFVLVGTGIAFSAYDDRVSVRIAGSCGAATALIGTLTIVQYAAGWNIGIDELLVRDRGLLTGSGHAGRMSPLTAAAWLALGIGIMCLAVIHDRRFIIAAHLLASFAGFIAFLAAASYAFGAEAFWGIGFYTAMAVHTASGLLIAAAAALMTRAPKGWLHGFAHSPGARALLGQLLPIAFILPVSLGLLLLLGSGLGAYNAAFGFALFAPIMALALVWVAMHVASGFRAGEEALREQEVQLSAFVEQATAGFAQVDLNGTFTLVNDRFCEITGRSRAELMKLRMQEITHPDDLPRNISMFGRAVADGTPYTHEKRYVRPDGSVVWVNNSVSVIRKPTGEPYGVLAVTIDVTERHRAEAAIAENEARLRALTDNLPGGMVYQLATGPKDEGQRFLFISQSCLKLTGYPAEDFLADPDKAYALFEDQELLARAEDAAKATGSPIDVQIRFRRADGMSRWARIISAPRNGPHGGRIWDGIMVDITDQKEAEALLVAMNETLEQRVAERTAERDRAWRNTQDVLITLARNGVLEAVNPAWTALLGFEESETVGRNFRDFIHPEDADLTVAAFSQADDVLESYQNRYRHKDGSWRWISWRAAREGDHIYASGRDVTRERKAAEDLARTQEALRQSQKMEAMGQLTGGVAHDFNNLLSPIIGSLDLLQRRPDIDPRMKRLIEGALTSAERAKTLVQRLLAFARRQPLQTTAVDVAELVEGMSGLLASTLGPGLRLDIDLEPSLPAARADANQLEMAVLNLAVNARDAMPTGGLLTIGAAADTLDKTNEKGLAPGHYIRLWVADTGVGMDEATLARSVEPFFSTKGLGRGTGLGLSMVHGLAAQLGGCLEMKSEPGSGTTIALWLPCADKDAASASPAGLVARPSLASGRILLVDDDDLVRSSTSEMLADLGYEVVATETARKALDKLEDGLVPDIVVTDHLMPGMTGVELARLLAEERPHLPVLIISGYAEVDGIANDLKRLAKPFRQADLAAALEEVRAEKRWHGRPGADHAQPIAPDRV